MFPSVCRWKVAQHNYQDFTYSDFLEIKIQFEGVLLLTASEAARSHLAWLKVTATDVFLK